MGRPSVSTPTGKRKGGDGSLSKPKRTPVPPNNNSTRYGSFRKFMGASRESLGFASFKEKRILQRYNRQQKKRTSLQICDSVSNMHALDKSINSVSNMHGLDKSITPSTDGDGGGGGIAKSKSQLNTTVEIDYTEIEKERQEKLEELQTTKMSEEEVKKRTKKRKKLTKKLQEKSKRGQPRMANHMNHLLGKIQHLNSQKSK